VHLPVTEDTKPEQEREVLATLAEHGVELTVMARYMQILSDNFVSQHPMRIINIHHSFLPAFVGANPYRQAHERGVKLIGATAHYATADLDEGPIIAQDTAHVTHRENVQQLTARGRDVETLVLSRAVRAHLEHKVAVHGHRTIVYS
jgi:formyltetrahydrofolate deformylase